MNETNEPNQPAGLAEPEEALAAAIAALRDAVPGHDELFAALTLAGGQTIASRSAAQEMADRAEAEAREAGERATALGTVLADSVAAYRRAVLSTEPALPAELVTGETVAEVDAAVERARATVIRVREALLAEAARTVPAGAPGRTPVDSNGMSPREKIALGLRG